jgi:hypothetical protein
MCVGVHVGGLGEVTAIDAARYTEEDYGYVDDTHVYHRGAARTLSDNHRPALDSPDHDDQHPEIPDDHMPKSAGHIEAVMGSWDADLANLYEVLHGGNSRHVVVRTAPQAGHLDDTSVATAGARH